MSIVMLIVIPKVKEQKLNLSRWISALSPMTIPAENGNGLVVPED